MAKCGGKTELDDNDSMGLAQELQLQMKKRVEAEERNAELEKQVAELTEKLDALMAEKNAEKSPKKELTEEEKKEAQKLSSAFQTAKRRLKLGKLSANDYLACKNACNTPVKKGNFMEAYKEYCEVNSLDVSENVSFESAMEHMKTILKL